MLFVPFLFLSFFVIFIAGKKVKKTLSFGWNAEQSNRYLYKCIYG